MGAVSEGAAVLESSVAGVVIVVGAEVAPVAVVGVEGRKTFAGTMALVPVADGSVGNWECSHKPTGHKQRLGELVAVVYVGPLGIRRPRTFRPVVGSRCCYGHKQVA
jgi:hypothetical protein